MRGLEAQSSPQPSVPPSRQAPCLDKGRNQPKTNKQLELMGRQLFLA